MLTFADEIDCSRGDMVVSARAVPETSARIEATLIWMSDQKLIPHHPYWLKIGTQMVPASIDRIRSTIDVNNLAETAGGDIALNDIGRVIIDLERPIPAITYLQNRKLGAFILIDRLTNATVAGGLVDAFPKVQRLASHDPERAIRWVMGRRRCTWTEHAAEHLRAQGQRVVILDNAAIAAFGAPDVTRVARNAARLLIQTGTLVFITLGVAPDDAPPDSIIDSETAPEGGGEEWVI